MKKDFKLPEFYCVKAFPEASEFIGTSIVPESFYFHFPKYNGHHSHFDPIQGYEKISKEEFFEHVYKPWKIKQIQGKEDAEYNISKKTLKQLSETSKKARDIINYNFPDVLKTEIEVKASVFAKSRGLAGSEAINMLVDFAHKYFPQK